MEETQAVKEQCRSHNNRFELHFPKVPYFIVFPSLFSSLSNFVGGLPLTSSLVVSPRNSATKLRTRLVNTHLQLSFV